MSYSRGKKVYRRFADDDEAEEEEVIDEQDIGTLTDSCKGLKQDSGRLLEHLRCDCRGPLTLSR